MSWLMSLFAGLLLGMTMALAVRPAVWRASRSSTFFIRFAAAAYVLVVLGLGLLLSTWLESQGWLSVQDWTVFVLASITPIYWAAVSVLRDQRQVPKPHLVAGVSETRSATDASQWVFMVAGGAAAGIGAYVPLKVFFEGRPSAYLLPLVLLLALAPVLGGMVAGRLLWVAIASRTSSRDDLERTIQAGDENGTLTKVTLRFLDWVKPRRTD